MLYSSQSTQVLKKQALCCGSSVESVSQDSLLLPGLSRETANGLHCIFTVSVGGEMQTYSKSYCAILPLTLVLFACYCNLDTFIGNIEFPLTWQRSGRWDCQVLDRQRRSASIGATGGNSRCGGSTPLVSASLPWDRDSISDRTWKNTAVTLLSSISAQSPWKLGKHAWCSFSKQCLGSASLQSIQTKEKLLY